MTSIDLVFYGRPRTYDRDRLTTACLVLLDVLDGRQTVQLSDTHTAALRLRADHQFTTDSITYALGAQMCLENGIEP